MLFLRFLEAFLLYAFLLVIFFYLWKFFNPSTQLLKKVTPAFITIGIINSENNIENVQEFNNETIKIGRGPQCDLLLDNPSVSGRHATISFTDDQWWIEDEGSRNGTFLHGNRLITPSILVEDDLLRFGDQSIKIIKIMEQR